MESLRNTQQQSRYPMIEMADAWSIIKEQTKQLVSDHLLGSEDYVCQKCLDEIANGDILAEEVKAADDLPPFRASVMDGYALSELGCELYEAVQHKSLAGTDPDVKVEGKEGVQGKGLAVYVTTGAPVPSGFISVVPIENIEKTEEGIKVNESPKEGQYIRLPGSDIERGATVLKPGQALNAAEIGLLATVGRIQDIKVYRRARVGLLSTGDELVAASTVDLPQGKIRDSNKRML